MYKKYYTYVILGILLLLVLSSCASSGPAMNEKLIRFHVIANSDSEADQELKLKVRDAVLKEIGPKLETSQSKEESENILKENMDLIKKTAQEEILKDGKSYPVSVALGKSIFPVKMYNDITLPPGEYDALKVVIGDGEGKNWWCVMFPPLCFIDITRGITSKETGDRLKSVLNDAEYDSILNTSPGDRKVEAVRKPIEDENKEGFDEPEEAVNKVEMKFKSIEAAKSLFDKMQGIMKR